MLRQCLLKGNSAGRRQAIISLFHQWDLQVTTRAEILDRPAVDQNYRVSDDVGWRKQPRGSNASLHVSLSL